MRWLGALVAAGCLAWAGSAGATAYVVDATSTPSVTFPAGTVNPQDEAVQGTATFAPISLSVGDQLTVDIAFSQPIPLQRFANFYVDFGPYSGPTGFDQGRSELYQSLCGYSADGLDACANFVGYTRPGLVPTPITYSSVSYVFAAAPEPSTWTLMIAGVGLIGLALRRNIAFRRSAVA